VTTSKRTSPVPPPEGYHWHLSEASRDQREYALRLELVPIDGEPGMIRWGTYLPDERYIRRGSKQLVDKLHEDLRRLAVIEQVNAR
jgi:hypothetical protein